MRCATALIPLFLLTSLASLATPTSPTAPAAIKGDDVNGHQVSVNGHGWEFNDSYYGNAATMVTKKFCAK